jgi:hypothetical protein
MMMPPLTLPQSVGANPSAPGFPSPMMNPALLQQYQALQAAFPGGFPPMLPTMPSLPPPPPQGLYSDPNQLLAALVRYIPSNRLRSVF